MKLNKYYTPEIEEFFVGFEYEHYDNKCNSWLKCFYETMYDQRSNQPLDELKMEFERVKYLDQEDIESLGFIKHKTIDNYWKLNNIVLRIKNFKISIYVYDDYTVDKLIFEGIIKNKSELIKLLKQLNINEIK